MARTVCVTWILVAFVVFGDEVKGQNAEDSRIFPPLETSRDKIRSFFDYSTHIVAYKDLSASKCYLGSIIDGVQEQELHLYAEQGSGRVLYVSNFKLTKLQIWRLAGSRVSEFCRGYPTYLLRLSETETEDANDLYGPVLESKKRPKRQTTTYFRGRRYKGQTQSQYLNFGTGTEPGKAEAVSTHDGSRAIVSGNSGMGQAQSQSGFGGGCEDCLGVGPGSQDQALSYRPQGFYPQGPPMPVGPGSGFGDGSGAQIPGAHSEKHTPGAYRRPGEYYETRGPGYTGYYPGLRPGELSRPGEIGLRPGESHYRPTNGYKPDEGVERPGEFVSRPSGLQPGEGYSRPGESGLRPGERLRPGDVYLRPTGEAGKKPDAVGFRPAEIHRPEETFRPGEGYRPGEGDRPSGGYRPGEGDRPSGAYRPGEHYRPGEYYTPGESYTPGEPHRPGVLGSRPGEVGLQPGEAGLKPEQGYKPGEILRPGEIYRPAPIPGEVYRPSEAGLRPGQVYRPTESNLKPGESFRPGEVGFRPGESNLRPSGGFQPSESFRPGETGIRPGESGLRPGEVYRPTGVGVRPAEIGFRPTGDGYRPSSTGLRPGDDYRPGEVTSDGFRPSEPSSRPTEIGKSPGGEYRPGEIGYRPGQVRPAPSTYTPAVGRPGDVHGGYPGALITSQIGVLVGQIPGGTTWQQPGQSWPQGPNGHTQAQPPPSQSAVPGPEKTTVYIPGGYTAGTTYVPGRPDMHTSNGNVAGQYFPGQITGAYGPESYNRHTPGTYTSAQLPGRGTGQPSQIHTPGQTVGRYPDQYYTGKHTETYIPGQTPGGVSGIIPDTSSRVPGYIPGKYPELNIPVYTSGQVTGPYIPGQAPGQSTGTPGHVTSTYIPGSVPGQYPGTYVSEQVPAQEGTYTSGNLPGTYIPGSHLPDRPTSHTQREYRPGEYRPGHSSQGLPGAYTPGLERGPKPGSSITRVPGHTPGMYTPERYDGIYTDKRIPTQTSGTYTSQGYTPGRASSEDDSDSQAQTSVQHVNNETLASASSQGRYLGGTAQSQVSGTYSGSGSFSAQAGTLDGRRGAQSQIAGGKNGVQSTAQGNGGAGQSQAQVQYSADTGGTMSSSQTSGISHGSNAQVEAGDKGGMADAQANGPGLTNSQAQIGFTPYEDGEQDNQQTPFHGGGTASAQSGSHKGQSQAQIQGKFRYGIRYTGAAQAGSGNYDRSALSRNATWQESLANLRPSASRMNASRSTMGSRIDPQRITTSPPFRKQSTTTTEPPEVSTPEDEIVPVTESLTKLPENKDQAEEDYDDYDDYDGSEEGVVSQSTRSQKQHVVLGPLEDIDAHVVQAYGDPLLKEGMLLQPGSTIPGMPGYQIPTGYRGRITSVANGENTKAVGANSQAQSVNLVPGTGRVVYTAPRMQFTQVRSGNSGNTYKIQPYTRQLTYPRFLSVTKSESGSRDLATGKKNPQIYYTQSSTCGFFTNTCVYSGAKKICVPKARSNPDGSPIPC